jgi:hypothetical protein
LLRYARKTVEIAGPDERLRRGVVVIVAIRGAHPFLPPELRTRIGSRAFRTHGYT